MVVMRVGWMAAMRVAKKVDRMVDMKVPMKAVK